MNIKELQKFKLPDKPGVYFFLRHKKLTSPQPSPVKERGLAPSTLQGKAGDEVLYIGKATSLRDRTKSYFAKDLIATRGPLIVDMVFRADSIKWEETDGVLEALILEANLIKKHQPYYNTKEKDDKSFNYVCITKESLPKVLVVRGKELREGNSRSPLPRGSSRRVRGSDPGLDPTSVLPLVRGGGKLQATFGPFTSGPQLREAMKIIRRIFPFIDAQSAKRDNAEFYRQLGLAPDLPVGKGRSSGSEADRGATLRRRQDYLRNIRHLELFFDGKKKKIIVDLKKEMMQYAKKHAFERAGEIKRQIFALEHINDVALLKKDLSASYFENHSLGSSTTKSFRIEAYDIAHMSGKNMVGVMTVLVNGEPAKNEYRKFNIKTQSGVPARRGGNDTGALLEVLERRFAHTEWQMPSLIVIDGGKAQFNTAIKFQKRVGLAIPLVSVVKDERHKAREILGDKNFAQKYESEILLANSESHRFAIAFHKDKRSKNFLK
ncbi:MAG: hypothetical protein A2909_03235 [Candidatus Tagabacteria bacterium RIFCSPLOWO2_01_FULL_39_11]|uniref:Excinuclease ABC subunit C n=1 Tax=Candidatus Tagabacteria bacterium RIFCSPLOWO2_01_FULL_39_11 TaxID=1802295 RepID=A0A1G2LUV5_9BACT|nr:MAG: hypothetical protein A2909_03235 [Candidatus Tagabacteria bacterium RIFCSPLOWO2_01_FULL_39_11]